MGTTQKAKYNWILEEKKGKGRCTEGAAHHSISGTNTLLPPTQHKSPARLNATGGNFYCKVALLDPQVSLSLREREKNAPFGSAQAYRGRKMEWDAWKKPVGGGSQPGNQLSTVCKVLQETQGALKSFEALGSAC